MSGKNRIYTDVSDSVYKEIRIISIRKDREVSKITAELLESLFEEVEETPSFKFADVQLLQQQVKSLELQMEKLSAQLEVISKLPALNPPEPSAEALVEESDVHGDPSGEVGTEAEPAVQEVLEEVHEHNGNW